MKVDVAHDLHLVISFKNETVVAAGVREFETAVRAAANSFVDVLNTYPDAWKNPEINAIRNFCADTQN
jgi:hypothetical protein